MGRKIHYDLQESQLKKVKFSFPGTLQKIIDLCQPHVIEIYTSDINEHENISWSKLPIHKTYYRKYNTRENNDELSGQPPKQNKELQVQYPCRHEQLPGQSLEQNEEFPVQTAENHEESPK